MHVILWVLKANDVRFETGKYQDIIKFVQHQMREQSESLTFLKVRHVYCSLIPVIFISTNIKFIKHAY